METEEIRTIIISGLVECYAFTPIDEKWVDEFLVGLAQRITSRGATLIGFSAMTIEPDANVFVFRFDLADRGWPAGQMPQQEWKTLEALLIDRVGYWNPRPSYRVHGRQLFWYVPTLDGEEPPSERE